MSNVAKKSNPLPSTNKEMPDSTMSRSIDLLNDEKRPISSAVLNRLIEEVRNEPVIGRYNRSYHRHNR